MLVETTVKTYLPVLAAKPATTSKLSVAWSRCFV